MAKKGSYLGGSTVIRTNPWLDPGTPPKFGRLGAVGIAAADADTFEPKTYVVKAADTAKRRKKKKHAEFEQHREKTVNDRRQKAIATVEAKQDDPVYQEKVAKLQESQKRKLKTVVIERKSSPRCLSRKPE